MKKKGAGFPVVSLIVALIVNAVRFGLSLSTDTLIIYLGAKGFKSLLGVAGGAAVIVSLIFLALLVRFFVLKGKEKKEASEMEQYMQDGMLSASGKLSDDYVMRQLVSQGRLKWKCLENDIKGLTDQLLQINSYQDRLSKLLANNSAQALSDTEDILEKIEQQILGNVRKVLNFMEVLGVEDQQTVKEYIELCRQENGKLLDATKDFLICVTDFLNGQGASGEAGLKMVEDFKSILVGNIGGGIGDSSSVGNGNINGNITLNL